MSTIKGLNYADMGITGSKQLGSDKEVKNLNKTDYSDGLSQAELQKIDTNGDGVITEKEFKAACKNEGITDKNAKNYWQTLTLFTQATSKAGKNASSTVSQKDSKGRTIETEFDKAGNVLSKKITGTDNSTVTTTYNKNGKPELTKYSNGKEISYEYNSKNKLAKQTLKRADGTKQVTEYGTFSFFHDKNNVTKTNDKNSKTVTEYDANNQIKSTSVTQKLSNGTSRIIVFDSNNEINSETMKFKDGKKTVTTYSGNTATTIEYGKKNQQLSKIVNIEEDEKSTQTIYDANNKFVFKEISEELTDGTTRVTHENENHTKTVQVLNSDLNILSTKRFNSEGAEITLADTINGKLDEYTYQGQTGDCWLLAGLNSINSTPKGQEIIKNLITKNDDGSYTVNFKGADKSYTVTAAEINSHDTDYSGIFDEYSNGDNDMLVIELAFEKLRQENSGMDLEGGYHHEVYEALTGLETKYYDANLKGINTSKGIDEALDSAMNNPNLVLGFSVYGLNHNAKQTNGEQYSYSIDGGHAFSITNVTKDTVAFVNPWDSGNPITMTRSEFKKFKISNLNGIDLKNVDPDNIQPKGMSKKEAKEFIERFNSKGGYIINELRGNGNEKINNTVRLKLLQELNSKLAKGSITNINKFVNDFASANKLSAADKANVKTVIETFANDNTLDYGDITATLYSFVMLDEDEALTNENVKTVANIIKSGKSVSQMAQDLDATGLLPKFNKTDFSSILSVIDSNNNKTLADNEFKTKAKTFLNTSIKKLKQTIEKEIKGNDDGIKGKDGKDGK